MLFTIINKATKKIESTNLDVFMVHYLFIDKKWDRTNCIIRNSQGGEMNYNNFYQSNHL